MKEMLYRLTETYHLTERTWEWFWKNYASYLTGQPEESAGYGLFSRESVAPVLHDKSYHISCDNEMEIIRITIHIYRTEDNRYTGEYSHDFDLNGNGVDDWFIIK